MNTEEVQYVKSDETMYITKNYDMFHKIKGNRSVSGERVAKILDSINRIGPQPVPLIVNEKFEIIDGQGRLEAFKRKGLPLYFIIKPGLTIKDCIQMNINQTPWSLLDYVKCYAENDDINFIRMLDLWNAFFVKDRQKNIMCMDVLATALFKMGTAPSRQIKQGNIGITENMYQDALNRLNYGWEIVNWVNDSGIIKMPGSLKKLVPALIYCYDYKEVDNWELIDRIKKYYSMMQPWTDIEGCIKQLDIVYNYNRKKNVARISRLYEDDTTKQKGKEVIRG